MQGIWKRVRRTSRKPFMVCAAVMLTPKLLVPVGCMPAALADGGPIIFCHAYGTNPVGGQQVGPAAAGLAAATSHGADADRHGGSNDHANGGDHDQWERCTLGGLASLAAITHDWSVPVAIAPGEPRIDRPALLVARGESIIAFRSRAPPRTHS